MYSPIDSQIGEEISKKIATLEERLKADVIFYYGSIGSGLSNEFREMINELKENDKGYKKLCIVLTTPGGSAMEVQRCVNVVRNFYDEIDFIIPDYAYSAGTIFCMSGDNIYMNYYSVLGPIDPQVQNKAGLWVAALGYLDKVNEMIDKSKNGNLSPAEFILFRDMDLGELREYEQAQEVTIDLLKTFLVNYKFKSWITHRTDPQKLGEPVTPEEKEQRASEIAKKLSDNNRWKSHSRPINIETLKKELKLDIIDFSADKNLDSDILSHYSYIMDYVRKRGASSCFNTRRRTIV